MFKKLGIALTIIILFFLAAVIVIPLVVNVDQYRPRIVEAANERINGKLELGKLSLSLWGQIRIQIEGLALLDAQNRKVLSVSDAFFHVPFDSILGGSPLLTLNLDQPEVRVVKEATGKMNIMTLMKEPTSAAPAPGAGGTPAAPSTSEPVNLPAMATRTRLGIKMTHALLTYQDELSGVKTQLKDLNLIFKDISLSRATQIEIWGDLDTTVGKTLSLRGPVRIDGKAEPTLSDGKFQKAALQFKANADDLEIISGTMFHKKKGIPARMEARLETTPEVATIQSLIGQFHNAEISVTGKILQLGSQPAADGIKSSPVVQLVMKSNEIELKPWSALIPMLKEYELGGAANFTAELDGPSEKLNYKADLAVKALTAKSPYLKSEPRIDASMSVVTDQIEKMGVIFKAPGNDLKVEGSMLSFTEPKVSLQITSSGMDIDQLVVLPPLGQKTSTHPADQKQAGSAGVPATGATPGAAESSDYDVLLEPLRQNKMAQTMTANVGINLAFVKIYDIKLLDIRSKLSMRDLVSSIDSFGMKVWGATMGVTAAVDLKPKAPTYKFAAAVSGLNLKEAVASQLQLFKNTVLGTAAFKMEGTGASFNPDAAKENINASGSLKVEKATFATIDVGKMAVEAVNKAIDRIADKFPQIKGKGLKGVAGRESRYDLISSDFTIGSGKFNSPNFIARAEKNQGIDLNGSTQLGLKDFALKAKWELIDTYNFTHAQDISLEVSGVKIDHILAEKGKPVRFPVEVGCTALAPCYSYTQVPEYLAKVAFNNATAAVQGKAKAEVQKRVEDLTKKAPPKVQEALKGLGKKLFGN